MMETSGLSHWLTSLLKPVAAPPSAGPAPAPVAFAPAEPPAVGAPAPGPHPNLVALYDRARAREAALQAERAAMEPKVMAAFGVLGLLTVGATVVVDPLAWGLGQWQSPWRAGLVAVPNALAVALLLRWGWEARRAVGELIAERKFPFAGHQALADPLACLGKDADGWLTGLVQDVHASNNAQDLSLRKQHERFQLLVRGLTRMGMLLVALAGYDAVWRQHAPVAAPPPSAPAGAAAPRAIAPTAEPTPAASPVASPAAQRPTWPIRPSAVAETARPLAAPARAAATPLAAPTAAAPRRALPAPRAQAPVRTRAPIAAPVAPPEATATAQPAPAATPALAPRAVAPTPAAPVAPVAPTVEKKPVAPAPVEKKPAAIDEPAAAPARP